jgi:Fur family transcriptional regulator, ferric uptake regulator
MSRRDDVLAALRESDGFLSAQQLYGQIRARGVRIGLATVYRTLQSLVDAGEVDSLRTDEGEAVYRRCSTGHHHHLICRHCGRTVEVDSVAVERWARRIAEQNGFADVEHVVEVFGTCATCAADRS